MTPQILAVYPRMVKTVPNLQNHRLLAGKVLAWWKMFHSNDIIQPKMGIIIYFQWEYSSMMSYDTIYGYIFCIWLQYMLDHTHLVVTNMYTVCIQFASGLTQYGIQTFEQLCHTISTQKRWSPNEIWVRERAREVSMRMSQIPRGKWLECDEAVTLGWPVLPIRLV